MNTRCSLRAFLVAAAVTLAPAASRAVSVNWDGTTGSYVLTSADDFNYTAGASSVAGLDVTARDFNVSGNLTLGGAFSFVQTGGGGLYQGIDLIGASSTITATAITLTGDIGKQGSDGNTLALNTSAANGAINLNVSLGRSGVWYIPAGLTANAGTGTITVSGTNGYGWRTAPVSLTGGAINFTGNVDSGGSISITNSLASSITSVLSGAMTLTKGGAGTLTLNSASTFTGNITINGGVVDVLGANNNTSPTSTSLGNMTTAGRTITVNTGATLRFTGSDAIGAYNYLTPVTLIADGGTISAGLAAVGVKGNFRSIGNLTLRNGGALVTANGNAALGTLVGSFAINGNVTVDGTSATGATISPEATQTFQNYIDLGSGAGTGSTTFTVAETNNAATADLTVTTVLANRTIGGAATLIKAGAGRMVLAASNAYSGGTTLRAGALVGSNSNAFGTSGTVTVNDASTGTSDTSLLIDATSGGVTISRNITVANQGSGTVTLGSATTSGSSQAIFSGAITLNKATTLTGGASGDRMGFTGGIGGTANVTIAGTNRVLFGGTANTYAGTTTINSGATLQLSDGTSTANSFLADASDVTVTGTLRLAKGGNSETIAGLNGAGTVSAIAGSDTLIVGSGNANGSFSGALNNGGATLALTKTGSGTQTLPGTSNYTGATTVSNGTLALGTNGVLGNTAVTIASGATFSTASGTTAGGSVTVNSGGTLTANGTISGAVSIAGTGTISGAANSTLGVTGTATVASGGSVSGTTTLTSGTLTANGTLGTVNVASGATLRGSGSAGAVTVANGSANLIAGTGTSGTLTLSSLTFAGTGSLTVGALSNYTSTAAFSITGALAVNGANVTLALPAGLISNGTYKLISYGSTSATDANFTVTGPVIGARQFGGLTKDDTNKLFLYTVGGDSPVWTGANSNVFNGGSNWNLINGGTATDFIANDALLLDDTATSTTVDISGGNVAPAVVTFDNSSKNYTLQGSSGLSSGSIVKNGTGNLTINNSNSADTVSVTAGTLTLGSSGALGSAVVTLSGGTLDLNNQSTSARIALAGGSIANNGTVNGDISGSGALAKSTAGTLTLSATNTYTGGTTVSNGVLALGHATDTLADAGAVTVSGGELSLGSNSDTVGALTLTGGSITGTGVLTASSLDLQAGTIGAKLAGSGAATKSGAGTVTLSSANSNYSGTVTVSAGTISVGDDAALGTGTVNLNGGDIALSGQTLSNTVSFGGGSISGNGTFSGSITGSSAFTKSGSGTLTISGNKTIGSGISVTGGTLSVTAGNLNSGSYAAAIATSGTGVFALTGNSNQTLSGVISGTGSLTKSGNGTLTLSGGANTLTGDVTITGGTVTITAASAAAQSTSPTTSGLGNMTVSRTITVDGSGTVLEFNTGDAMGAFGYASPVMLVAKNGGAIVRASTGGGFNSIGAITLQEGGILRANAGPNATVQSLSLNGNVTVLGTTLGGTIEAVAGSNNGIHLRSVGSSGNLTFDVADTAASADLNVTANLLNPVQVNYAGINASGTNTGIIKTGAGRMVLAGTNSFTGSVAVNAGTLAITGSNTNGGAYTVAAGATLSISGSGGIFRGGYAGSSITLGSGSTLEVAGWGYNESTGTLGGLTALSSGMVVNGSTIRVTGASPTTYGRGVTVNSGGVTLEAASGANWTIDTVNDSNAWIFNGNPSVTLGGAGTGAFQKVLGLGTGALTKAGAGTWTLSGANTYSGGTTVSNGTLVAGNGAAFGSGAITLSAGTLDVNGNSLANNITLSGGTLAGAGTLSGVLSGSGALTKSTNGSLVLSNANTFSGGTALSGGTLTLGNDGALGSGSVALSGGTLDINGRAIANDITLSGGSISGAGTLSGILSGTGGLSKSSAGTLTLSGANTYSGATSVTNGTLALSSGGSLAADSSVSVSSGATLGVASGAAVGGSTSLASGATLTANGTLAAVSVASGATLRGAGTLGDVTVADGNASLTAGNAGSGTLSISSLTFAGAGVLNIGALSNYTSSAAFAVTGDLSQTSALNPISIALPVGVVTNGTYQLISFGTTSLDIASFSVSGPVLGGRQSGSLVKSGNLFQYVVAGTSPKWTGINGSTFSGGGNWTIIDGDGSADDYLANDTLLVDDTATGTTLDISGADVTPLAINFANSTKDFTLQGSHGITSGSLVKSGSGNLTIANANSLATASIESGTVTLAGSGALDGTAVTLSGGTLDLNGETTSASIALSGGTLTGNGTVSGVISGSAGFSKSTAGTLTLSGSNTYTGGTSVSDGVLALGNATDTLADTESVTVSGGELSLGSNSDTVGAVTLSGGSITGSGTLTGSSYALQSGSVSAILGGSAAVTKSGAGTVTLSGANTFSGGTTVSNGVLALSDDNALGTGSVSLAGGSVELSGQTLSNAIAFSGGSVAGNGTLSGALSGSSALTKSGNGTVTISADNALGSGINVTGGTLAVSGTLGGGTYAAGIATSGTIAFTSASNQTLSSVVSGSGSLAKSGDGTLTLSGGASTFTGDVNITGGKVIVSAASAAAQGTNPTSSGLGNIASGTARTITVDGSTSILEFATPDAIGAFGYNNSNIMLVARNGGVITRTSGAFNSIGSITLEEGGILRGNNGQNGTVNSMSINGSVTVTGTTAGGTIESVGTTNAGIHLRSIGSSGNVTFTVADTAADVDLLVSARLVNPIQINYFGYNANGTGAGITKEGLGKMSLTAANGFSRGVTINAGVVSAGHANALGAGAVTLNGGALDVAEVTLANNITAAGGSITGSGTLSGVISGSGALSVSSSGSLLLTGTNTFSGGLTLNAGSLSGNAAAAFGTGAITVNGGSLDLGGYTLGSDITLTGGALAGTSGLTGSIVFSNLTLTFADLTTFGSAAITVGAGATLDFADFNPTNAITLNGGTLLNYSNWNKPVTLAGNVDAALINNLAANEVTVTTGSTVDLTGVSKDIVFQGGTLSNLGSYTGTLTVQSALDLSANVPSGDATIRVGNGGTVDFGGNAFAGTVEYTGGTVSNFDGDVKVTGADIELTAGNLGSANVVVETGASISIGAGFGNNVRINGGTITGDTLNNFIGTVTVASGSTLDLDGADSSALVSSAATIVVESGATLKGSATVGNVTVQAGGILAPGNSPGMLNFANLTLGVDPVDGTAGSMTMEIDGLFDGGGNTAQAGVDFDSVTVAGELNLSELSTTSRFVLNLLSLAGDGVNPGAPRGWDPASGFELAIFSYSSLYLGGNTDINSLFAINSTGFLDANGLSVTADHFHVYDDATSQQVRLVYSAVPEPSTYGLMLGGLALAVAAYRRRRSRTA